jgi:PleD family two-component response regulator
MVTHTTRHRTDVRHAPAPQKVAIVSASADMLAMIEALLDPGRYNLVFIESSAHAYSEIKRLRPNLVILCTRLETMDGFQVLSMLKIDADTRDIPVVTFTTEDDAEAGEAKTASLAN